MRDNSHVLSLRRGRRSTGRLSGCSDGEAKRQRGSGGGLTDGDEGVEVSATGCGGGAATGCGAGARGGGRWAEAVLLPFPSRCVPRDTVGEVAPDVSRWGEFARGKRGVRAF